MVSIFVLLTIAVISLILFASIRRLAPRHVPQISIWKATIIFYMVRMGFIWISTLLLATSGAGQGFAYFILAIATPEAWLIRNLRGQPMLWLSVLAGLVSVGSYLWVKAISMIAAKIDRK